MKSKLFTLDFNDFINGFLVAILSSVVGVVLESLNMGSFVFNWQTIFGAALIGGLGYIKKNLLSNDNGQFLTRNKF